MLTFGAVAACRVFVCESCAVYNEPGYGCASCVVQRETFWCLELIYCDTQNVEFDFLCNVFCLFGCYVTDIPHQF